jgi:hypothetical protein
MIENETPPKFLLGQLEAFGYHSINVGCHHRWSTIRWEIPKPHIIRYQKQYVWGAFCRANKDDTKLN